MKKLIKALLLLNALIFLTVIVIKRSSALSGTNSDESAAASLSRQACEDYLINLTDLPETASGTYGALYEVIRSSVSIEIGEKAALSDISDEYNVTLCLPDEELLMNKARELMYTALGSVLKNATDSSGVYDDNQSYKTDVLEEQFEAVLPELTEETGDFTAEYSFLVTVERSEGEWVVSGDGGASDSISAELSPFKSADTFSEDFRQELFSSLEYISKDYAPVEETALKGYMPDEACYGECETAEEVVNLLSTPKALNLIGEEKLSWNEDIQLASGTKLKYYLDDTILVLTWNELHGKFTETFSEVFIADGSQLRRKLTDDIYHSETLLTVQELSQQSNAVLAESGDMCGRRNRDIGIFVYNREIYRFEPGTGDTCFIDSKGDLLFSHRGELSERKEAESYIKENDILFSLCFGPVLIENGAVSIPEGYPWGEPYEDYMRNGFGQIGPRHYLIYNSDFMTVSDAAEIMLNRGCISAYALDGGFTACTVLNNIRINPIINEERPVSDIICFVTAIPDSAEG